MKMEVLLLVLLIVPTVVGQALCQGGCAIDAFCNNDVCQCNPGFTSPQPEFYCYMPDTSSNTFVSCSGFGDPHMTNFLGEMAALITPCRFRALEVVSGMCFVDAFGVNNMYSSGYVYVESMVLTLTSSVDTLLTMTITLPHSSDGTVSGDGNTQTIPHDGTPLTFTVGTGGPSVTVLWNHASQQYVITSSASDCNFRFAFRPYYRNGQILSQFQEAGFLFAWGSPNTIAGNGDYPQSICSRRDNATSYANIQNDNELNSPSLGLVYAFLEQTRFVQVPGDVYFQQCTDVKNTFQNSCPDMWKSTAVNGCGIFLEAPLVTCLLQNNRDNFRPMNVFRTCINNICGRQRTSCEAHLASINTICADGTAPLLAACNSLPVSG